MGGDLNIPSAAALLVRGGVLAYPTEAVWGLGCAPFDGEGVAQRVTPLIAGGSIENLLYDTRHALDEFGNGVRLVTTRFEP